MQLHQGINVYFIILVPFAILKHELRGMAMQGVTPVGKV